MAVTVSVLSHDSWDRRHGVGASERNGDRQRVRAETYLSGGFAPSFQFDALLHVVVGRVVGVTGCPVQESGSCVERERVSGRTLIPVSGGNECEVSQRMRGTGGGAPLDTNMHHPLLHPVVQQTPPEHGLWRDFERLHVVGKGSFGTAILCRRKCDNNLIVLKQVDLRNMKAGDRKSAVKEAQLLSILKHENIVTYFSSRVHDGQLFIEMEFCSEGTLDNFLARLSKRLPELDVLSIFRQIVCALVYLDDMNILHRFVSPPLIPRYAYPLFCQRSQN